MASWIKEWLMLVLVAAGVGVCGDAVLSSGTDGKGASASVGKYVRMIMTLCVLCAALLPVIGHMDELKGMELFPSASEVETATTSDSVYKSLAVSECRSQLEAELSQYISDKFGINEPLTRIELREENKDGISEVRIVSVNISIPFNEVPSDYEAVREYAEELTGCNDITVASAESEATVRAQIE